ncbi:AI-2E family transporter [Plantactinospora siamensis]|uniref:AI-2E family transporter n=1 Tax=Plantactinospora siamensis TaxID=555372 RepID=A0ABV6P256_9ACTN
MNGPGPASFDDRRVARRVLITIGLVLATVALLGFGWATRRVLVWILIAAFFAVALYPAVEWTQRRGVRHRSLATLLVFLTALLLFGALITLIVAPLVGEAGQLADRLPKLAEEARTGQGRIGDTLDRLHLRRYVQTHSAQIREYGGRFARPTVTVLKGALVTVAGMVTVVVLAYLMVLQAPRILAGVYGLVPDRHLPRLRRVGGACARTITGYLTGNLLISAICGALTFAVMAVMGVPYAGVLAVLVAVADLVPLVGATIGAVLAGGASLLHSPTAGIVVLVFFVVYQQLENHLLQPLIYSRIVRLSPLTVLIAVLIAADLAGIAGALLAIPAAAIGRILLTEACGRDRSV